MTTTMMITMMGREAECSLRLLTRRVGGAEGFQPMGAMTAAQRRGRQPDLAPPLPLVAARAAATTHAAGRHQCYLRSSRFMGAEAAGAAHPAGQSNPACVL